MMPAKFYIIVYPDTNDACLWFADEGTPAAFDNEDDAVEVVKNSINCPAIVVRATVRITPVQKYKVERFK